MSPNSIGPAAAALLAAAGAFAADWNNSGGNACRNGLTTEIGPTAQDLLWSGGRPSIIAWQPVIEGDRVFMVRQTGFPPSGEPNGSPVVAMNLNTGEELWATHIPFNEGDWTTWIAGARDGRVYASRSGNGASVSAAMYALDASDGSTAWISQDLTAAGAYDGVVFAPDGDLLVADFRDIHRLNAEDGSTVWHAARVGSVSGQCGGCIFGDAFYVADAAPGGTVIKRFDLTSGAFEYQSPVMPGFTVQNTPFCGPDGTVYLSRTQNNVNTDFFYAFQDTGTELVERWHVPARWTVVSEFGAGPDASVYMMAPGDEIHRLHPADGTLLSNSGPIDSDFVAQPRMAVDAAGKVFLSNGSFTLGRLYSFNADLTLRWSEPLPNSNIGTPSLGRLGTLVIAGVGTNVKAYRSAPACDPCDTNCDGSVNGQDIQGFVQALQGAPSSCSPCNSDANGDGSINGLDIEAFVACLTG